MDRLPILEFESLLKTTVWGGRRLGELLGKPLPGEEPVGESWEVADLPDDQSVVGGGPFDGVSLSALREQRREELLGDAPLPGGRFPLLIKFIDAQRTLSVQVHPDEAACARIGQGARPKTEAWYVIDRDPGAALYVGLRSGVDREAFARAIREGEVASLLHRMPVDPGDFAFLPAGTVHAIGEGIVLAEVQQASDTTYRVFDWNRVGLDGKPRQLHVEHALEATNYDPVGPPEPRKPASGRAGIACPFFEMELVRDRADACLAGSGPAILLGVKGGGARSVRADGDEAEIVMGRTLLVPAERAAVVELGGSGDLEVLAVRIPDLASQPASG
ncbi:MAG: type I phosphomannose isomerase catalytic subunit [Polyangia bacterium]